MVVVLWQGCQFYRGEKTTPFGVNLTRSLVIYQAAQKESGGVKIKRTSLPQFSSSSSLRCISTIAFQVSSLLDDIM